MERNYMNPDSLVELEYLSEPTIGTHNHEDFELLFLTNGKLSVSVEEKTFQLSSGDFIVVNAGRDHAFQSVGPVFLGRFMLSAPKIREILGQQMVLFWCTPEQSQNKAYDDLRRIIISIFNHSMKPSGERKKSMLYLNSLYYQMLDILSVNFLLTENDIRYREQSDTKDDRTQQIFDYIRMNYRQDISLQEIAEQLYLSPTYISKYIKRKCGVNFVELVNSVRLSHAMQDLIYSDASIMKIAMDNGFASVAAYNKAFRDTYHQTPSEYRKNKRQSNPEAEKKRQEQEEKAQRLVQAYLEKNPLERAAVQKESNMAVLIDVRSEAEEKWVNNFGRLINAGTALDLTKSTFRDQILAARNHLKFEYVRFWDIYAPEFFIDIHKPKEQHQFSRLDVVTDFLVKNHMKPYIELGAKPLRLLKTTQEALKEETRDLEFDSDEEMRDFYSGIMQHFINRYGSAEVSSWYFEYWEKESLSFQDLRSYQFSPMSLEDHERYFHCFDVLAGALRSRMPDVKVGGGGFPLQHYGVKGFTDLLTRWKTHLELPDFISLSCYPYQIDKEENTYFERRSTDIDFVRHNLDLASQVIQQTGFPTSIIHVTEYSLTLSNRNAINDSCLKGAFLVQNAISCTGHAEMLGHWLFTDAYAEFHDSDGLLFGGCGIMSKNGIPKPGFYAFEFLSRLFEPVLAKGRNFLITGNERGSIRMICHNLKGLNYNYYMAPESTVKIQDIPSMLEDQEYLTIHLQISGLNHGIYAVKQRKLNHAHGSIQDEWLELNAEADLTMEEMDYLHRVSMPKLCIQEVPSRNGRIEFDVQLKPNEIQYIHVFCK